MQVVFVNAGDDLLGRRKDVDSTCQMSRQLDRISKDAQAPVGELSPFRETA